MCIYVCNYTYTIITTVKTIKHYEITELTININTVMCCIIVILIIHDESVLRLYLERLCTLYNLAINTKLQRYPQLSIRESGDSKTIQVHHVICMCCMCNKHDMLSIHSYANINSVQLKILVPYICDLILEKLHVHTFLDFKSTDLKYLKNYKPSFLMLGSIHVRFAPEIQ